MIKEYLPALKMLVKPSVLEQLHLCEQLAAVQSCCSSLAAKPNGKL